MAAAPSSVPARLCDGRHFHCEAGFANNCFVVDDGWTTRSPAVIPAPFCTARQLHPGVQLWGFAIVFVCTYDQSQAYVTCVDQNVLAVSLIFSCAAGLHYEICSAYGDAHGRHHDPLVVRSCTCSRHMDSKSDPGPGRSPAHLPL
jgi:hypothetical protein